MGNYSKTIFDALMGTFQVAPTDLLYWRGDYPDYDATARPQPGDEISMGSGYEYNQYAAKDSMPDLIRVPYTSYGDYGGSSVERSNCEALFEDFPQFFIKTNGGWDSHELLIPTYWQPDEDDEDPEGSLQNVLDIITGLGDYPLYDEEHHSNLEMEAASEAWSQYLSADIRNQMCWRKYRLDDDVFDAVPDEQLQEIFWEIDRLQDAGPYLEDAVNIVFPYFDREVEAMLPIVATVGYRILIQQARGNHGLVKHLRDERKAFMKGLI